MLKAISYWLQATNLVGPEPSHKGPRPPLVLTELAELILEYDPYLEDMGTLWSLHLELASNRHHATFWYWAFNEFPQREFVEERLVQGMRQYIEEYESPPVAESSLQKDARCFIRTYLPSRGQSAKLPVDETLDSPLTLLGLLRETPMAGQFKFQVGPHRGLPTALFAYALYRFRERTNPTDVIISLEDLRWTPLSPGRLLCLDMRSILDYLEELENRTSYAQVIRTAGLNMVSLSSSTSSLDLLEEYYAAQNKGRHG